MNKKNIQFIIILLISLFSYQLKAQEPLKNDAFDVGEELTYDLYYKYGLVNMRGGKASLNTNATSYDGKDAYKMTLRASTRGLIGSLFTVDDTLTSYIDKDLIPQLFVKGALELGDYTHERQIYSYTDGEVSIRTIRYMNGELRFDETVKTSKSTYDMVSILAFARTLDYSEMSKEDNVQVQFISGRNLVNMYIRHKGITNIKVNNGETYEAIELSLMILDDAFVDQEEAMRVWISNDKNKIPLQIYSKLKIGEMRSILKSYKGIKHPIN